VITRACDECTIERVIGIDGEGLDASALRLTVLAGCDRCAGSFIVVPVQVVPRR